ncbi:hydrolase TatD [Siphonobacter sp. BAB-5405]|uniref:Qat anti-phage system TatD family nuclease QatD n=1 Tax=Siphonobacter sp. BAB-5405 TaxID=1864825 RepID=UPI000C809A46|nr:Qat anti-phage system TatD family nuclease QatD [Siphonobacter sp. BAB-5405]PMD87481.1 hydrolase TatD [Siphonobacter sp. BAB-5405]
MSYYVDTHCHLDLFPNIRKSVSEEDAFSIKTITVTNTPILWEPNVKLFRECQNIRIGLGLHPELASQRIKEIPLFVDLCKGARYIGEIGLDGTSKDVNERQAQLLAFRQVLKAIKNHDSKILTIHSRKASKETISELISNLKGTQHQVILHWYSGGFDEMKLALKAGFYFSINHKMFTSKSGQQLIQLLPKASLLTETDAPFTFSDSVTTRYQSLENTLSSFAKQWKCDEIVAKNLIWENFKNLLNTSRTL